MIIIENIRVTSLAIELLSMLALFKQFLKYYIHIDTKKIKSIEKSVTNMIKC